MTTETAIDKIVALVEIFLNTVQPDDLIDQIYNLWNEHPGQFNPDSKISQAIAAAIQWLQ